MDKPLITRRLNLRFVSQKDLSDIHELHRLPETDEFNALGIPDNIDQTNDVLQQWVIAARNEQSPEYTFSLRDKITDAFIGLISLKCGNPKFRIAEVWYKLHLNHWGMGYATEALRGVLDFGFNALNLHRIEAGCAIANIASMRVMEKAGMLREGIKRKTLPLKNGWSDNFMYGILEEDWQNQAERIAKENFDRQ